MKTFLTGFLVVIVVGAGLLGLRGSLAPVSAQGVCDNLYARADGLLNERRNALAEGDALLAIELAREAREILAPCEVAGSDNGLFAAGDANQWVPVISSIGDMPMVQVPAGCFLMGSDSVAADQQPVHEQCLYTTYWIGQTEVTRANYENCVADHACESLPATVSSAADQPASPVTWAQAEAYCAWQGMRLPTEAEWEYAARGPAGLLYPWGNEFEADNLVFGGNSNNRPVAVGSLTQGASWVGALDMSGNVGEWTSTVYEPYPYNFVYNMSSDPNAPRVVRGGDYHLNLSTRLSSTFRGSYVSYYDLDFVGFRCTYVPTERSGATFQGDECTVRVNLAQDLLVQEDVALSQANVSYVFLLVDAATNLLTPCMRNATWSPQVEVVNGIEMVQVPPGCFQMGRADGEFIEQPVHEVCFSDDFWLDKTEVTRAMYAACVASGACTETHQTQHSLRNTQPINGVTWFQADAYCAWRDARLPTEAEWEYAARGPDGWLYPWGDTFMDDRVSWGGTREFADVGSFPAGASWVGALDMSGNALEWVSSLALDYPYVTSAAEQPGVTGERRVMRGGSFIIKDANRLTATSRLRSSPDYDFYTNGFRCARDNN